ncbi:DUF485 domain-containing protein [Rhodococcus sp. TAF43]|uniref:DUF485 domain-containing protein n=1 Tax=unclassified Rhodococcus (in: high G+C Gram-positive bacteria) TaxID=192944 RepID=UPI000E0AFCB9|nr:MULTISPECIES: DUF485 domain-containing protein [unclassified Rhodococcus (in: high G+C Gram-positive bacteria)]QKT13618.1 DUF485 domain-containing protein [Rhodococcus sp. W8901]RDI16720.1 uncharacterized protein DUF485 [Rhodococcus sp. AG1013]
MSIGLSPADAAPPDSPPVDPALDAILDVARRRRRVSLGSAAVLLTVFMGYIALTTSTTVLSGRWGGLGVAYWVGFAIFAGILVVAQIYVRWARRMDAIIDTHLASLDDTKDGE